MSKLIPRNTTIPCKKGKEISMQSSQSPSEGMITIVGIVMPTGQPMLCEGNWVDGMSAHRANRSGCIASISLNSSAAGRLLLSSKGADSDSIRRLRPFIK